MGRELLVVTPLYIVLALMLTFPLLTNFSDFIVGDMESDVWKHVWGMWWTRLKLVDMNVLPLHTHILNYPYGGALFFIDPLNALISVPLQSFLPVTVVFNIMVLFNIVLAGVGGFCLARYLCRNAFAAFFAGAVLGCSGFMLANITSGVTEAINYGWIPLFAFFFIRSLHECSLPDSVRAAVFFGCATLGSWYYGSFCVVFAVFYYVYVLLWRYRLLLAHSWKRTRQALRWPWSGPVRMWLGLALSLVLMRVALPHLSEPFRTGMLASSLPYLLLLVLAAFWACVLIVCLLDSGEGASWDDFRLGRSLWALVPAYLVLAVVVAEVWGVWRVLWESYHFLGIASPELVFLQAAVVAGVLYVVWLGFWRSRPALNLTRRLLTPLAAGWSVVVALGLLLLSILGLYLALADLANTSQAWELFGATVSFALSIVLLYLEFKQREERLSCGRLGVLVTYRTFCWEHRGVMLFLAAMLLAVTRFVFPGAGEVAFLLLWLCVVLFFLLAALALSLLEATGRRYIASLHDAAFALVCHDFRRRMLLYPFVMAVIAGLIIVGPAVAFRQTINSGASLVFRGRDGMNVDIHLSRRFMNVSCLQEMVRPGKLHSTRSYTVDKLTRVSYLGLVTLGVVAYGFLAGYRRRHRTFWLVTTLVFATFALGPFCYVTDNIHLTHKSPFYMAFFHYFPSFSQISIPYRFISLVLMSLGVLAAFTLSSLYRHRSRREQALLTFTLTMALFFDIAVFSPAPYPLPLSSVRVPEYCHDLAADRHEVGLIDYPIQRYKGELLPGEYFFFQQTHHKSIPNRVEGTIPLFVFQNSFSNYLFVLEHSRADIPPRDQATLERGLEDLSRFRFRYLVIHDQLIRDAARERMHTLLTYYLGQPKRYPDRVAVYRIPPNLRFPARPRHSDSSTTSQL